MANSYFKFKQFTIEQDACAMKVTTDGCLFGAWVAMELAKQSGIKNALDIGAGTGLLSLMVAQQNPVIIDAVEIDGEAASQAKDNISNSGFTNIHVHHNNILKSDLGMYDCMFSNPPFYEKELASPHSGRALAHHGNGLQLGPLAGYMATHLTSEGIYFLLLPTKRLTEAEQLLGEMGLAIHKLVIVKQTPTHAPFRAMLSGGKTVKTATTTELVIRKEDGSYSSAFTELLKDYYLYL